MKKNIVLNRNKIKYKDTKIGLHCHCEETKEALIELLEKAKSEQAKYLAITNHKSLKIYSKVLAKLPDKILEKYKDIYLIPSVELATHIQYTDLSGKSYGIEAHILGYGLNLKKEDLLDKFVNENYRQLDQEQELQRLIKIGHKIGLTFEDKDAYIDTDDGNRRFAGRAFMQAVMKNVELNFNSENEENVNKLPYELRTNWGGFHNRCVKDINSPFYHDLTELNPPVEKVINLIHDMGGKAYIAHPSAYFAKNGTKEQVQMAYDNVVEFTNQFMSQYSVTNNPSCHIDGIEMYHPSYLKNMQLFGKMKILVDLYKLGTSGGTDIHVGSIRTNQHSTVDDSRGGKVAIKKLKRFKELKKLAKSTYQIRKEVLKSETKEERE